MTRQKENFLVLMENYDKAAKYAQTASDSYGTAMEKMGVYDEGMESKTKKLIATFEKLSQTLINSGVAKGVIDGLNFTLKNTIPILIAIAGIIATIKADTIFNGITSLLGSIGGLSKNIWALITNFKTADVITTQSASGFTTFSMAAGKATLSVSTLQLAMAGITLALTIGIKAWQDYSQQQEEYRQKQLELAAQASDTASNLSDLNAQYQLLAKTANRTAEQDTQFKSLQEQIIPLLKDKKDALKGLTDGTNEYAIAVDNATKAEYKKQLMDITSGRKAAEEELENTAGWAKPTVKYFGSGDNDKYFNIVNDVFEGKIGDFGVAGKVMSNPQSNTEILEYYSKLEEAFARLNDKYRETSEEAILNGSSYRFVKSEIDRLKPSIDQYIEAKTNEAYVSWEATNGTPKTIDDYNKMKEATFKITGANVEFKDTIAELVDKAFPEFSQAINKAKDDANNFAKPVTLSVTIDNAEKAGANLKSLTDVLDDFKEKGKVTTSTLKNLNKTFGNLTGYEDFLKVLTSSKSTMPDIQNAVNSLATEYLSQSDILEQIDNGNKDLIVSELKLMGVTNAEEVATQAAAVAASKLTQAKVDATLSAFDFSRATGDSIEKLYKECVALGMSSDEVTNLIAQKLIAGNPLFANMTGEEVVRLLQLSDSSELAGKMVAYYNLQKQASIVNSIETVTSDEVTELIRMASALGIAGDEMSNLVKKREILARYENGFVGALNPQDWAILNDKFDPKLPEVKIPKVTVTSPNTKDKKPASNGRDKSQDPLKADIDRYEQLTTAINDTTNAIELLKLAEEDLSGQDKIDNINEQIKLNKELAQSYNDLEWEQKKERNDIRFDMQQQGFTFDGTFNTTNTSSNYKANIDKMYADYNAMPASTEIEKDKKDAYLVTIHNMEAEYKRILALNDDVYDTQKKQIGALKDQKQDLKDIEATTAQISADKITDLQNQLDALDNPTGTPTGTPEEIYNKRISLNEQKKVAANKEADRLRATGKSNTSEEVQAQKKIYTDADKEIFDLKLQNKKDYIEKSNAFDSWGADNEVKAWQRVLDWLKTEYPNAIDAIAEAEKNLFTAEKNVLPNLQSELQRTVKATTDILEDQRDSYDFQIEKLRTLAELTQKRYDTENKLRNLQKDIDKELAASKVMSEYLDPTTRNLLFNEDDYKELSDKLAELGKETSAISDEFYRKISRLGEKDQAMKELLTKEYERQLAMKEQEYELAKATLDVNKKQTELNNILAEKNVDMIVGTERVRVANTEDVTRAMGELADLEATLSDIRVKGEQQANIDSLEAKADNLAAEQAAIDNRIKMINDDAEKMNAAIENVINPIKTFSEIMTGLSTDGVTELDKMVVDFINSIGKLTGSEGTYKGTTPAKNTTGKPKFIIDGKPMEYASGTRSSIGGIVKKNEKGYEFTLENQGNGQYVALNEGSPIFNNEDTKRLWEWAKINPNKAFESILTSGSTIPSISNNTTNDGDTVYNLSGIVIEHVADLDDFMLQATQQGKARAQLTKNN